jgi:hypothetical protein
MWGKLRGTIKGKKKALVNTRAFSKFGGSGEIRTHGGGKPSSVFKTGALNRSATLPWTPSYK